MNDTFIIEPAKRGQLDRWGKIIGLKRNWRWGIRRESDKKYRQRMVDHIEKARRDDIAEYINASSGRGFNPVQVSIDGRANKPQCLGQITENLLRRWIVRALCGTGGPVEKQNVEGVEGGGDGPAARSESD